MSPKNTLQKSDNYNYRAFKGERFFNYHLDIKVKSISFQYDEHL